MLGFVFKHAQNLNAPDFASQPEELIQPVIEAECQICNIEPDSSKFMLVNPCTHRICLDCWVDDSKLCPLCGEQILDAWQIRYP